MIHAAAVEMGRREWTLAAAVFLGAVALFWPATGFDFLGVDDGVFVTENHQVQKGLTPESIAWAFGNFHASNWVPLTFVSLMADRSVYGPEPFGFHLTNVLLHAVNAALLFVVGWRMTGRRWASVLVALLFAAHPMRVESVAWVAERKDVLSTAFWLTTTLVWVEWIRAQRAWLYALALALFALGLTAKGMLVTLPVTLLLLDVWPLRREEPWSRLVVEKLPLFGMAIAGAAVTFAAQSGGTSVTSVEILGPTERGANAIVGYATYLWRSIWPVDLAYFHPHPSFVPPYGGWSTTRVALSAMAVAAATVGSVWLARRGHRFVLVGWAWYLVTLLPVIGLVQIGLQSTANRYIYVPGIGLLWVLVFGGIAVYERWPQLRGPALAVSALLVLASAVATARELPHWRDSETLFRRAIAVTQNNGVAMEALGGHLAREGRWAEARKILEEAVRVQPRYAGAHATLGMVLTASGKDDQAMEHLRLALELTPEHARARIALANVYARRGQLSDALRQYQAALEIDPRLWEAHFGLGQIARARGNTARSREHFSSALEYAPDEASRSRVRPFLD